MKTYRAMSRVAAGCLITSLTLFSAGHVAGASGVRHTSAAKKVTIAFIQQGLTNPFWIDQARGASEAARRLGITVENISGNVKIADQVQRMNDAINQHVDGIEIIPIDPMSIVPALIRAEKAHIPTLVLYSDAPHATYISGFDEYQSGRLVGQYAAQLLKQKYGTVHGQIAVLKGQLGQTLDKTRTGGFTDVLKQYPGIKIVDEEPTDWTSDKAVAIMQDWLVKYPNLTLVYGLSDTITVPAIDVARRSPQGKTILFASIDGDPIGITAIKQGTLSCTALYGPIYAGYNFTALAYKMVTHVSMPHYDYLTGALITTKNVGAALRMENDMSTHIRTFNFSQTLARALASYTM